MEAIKIINIVEGAEVKIVSFKHNGKLHRSWENNTILSYENGVCIGGNYATIVSESDGRLWRTTEPALFYFEEHQWFNVIIVFEGDDYFYYCNICSPCEIKNGELHYIDYDIDIIVRSNYSYEIVDGEEFVENKSLYNYPDFVYEEVNRAIEQVEKLIQKRKSPFDELFITYWLEKFKPYIS